MDALLVCVCLKPRIRSPIRNQRCTLCCVHRMSVCIHVKYQSYVPKPSTMCLTCRLFARCCADQLLEPSHFGGWPRIRFLLCPTPPNLTGSCSPWPHGYIQGRPEDCGKGQQEKALGHTPKFTDTESRWENVNKTFCRNLLIDRNPNDHADFDEMPPEAAQGSDGILSAWLQAAASRLSGEPGLPGSQLLNTPPSHSAQTHQLWPISWAQISERASPCDQWDIVKPHSWQACLERAALLKERSRVHTQSLWRLRAK